MSEQVDELLKEGKIYCDEGKYNEALEVFNKFIGVVNGNQQQVKQYIEALEYRTTVYEKLTLININERKSLIDLAIQDLKEIINKDDNDTGEHEFKIGILYKQIEEYDNAILQFKLANEKGYVDAQAEILKYYYGQGEYSNVVELGKTYLAQYDKDEDINLLIPLMVEGALYNQSDYKECGNIIARYGMLQKNQVEKYYIEALCAMQGAMSYTNAVSLLEQGRRISAENNIKIDSRRFDILEAEVNYRLEKYNEAEEIYFQIMQDVSLQRSEKRKYIINYLRCLIKQEKVEEYNKQYTQWLKDDIDETLAEDKVYKDEKALEEIRYLELSGLIQQEDVQRLVDLNGEVKNVQQCIALHNVYIIANRKKWGIKEECIKYLIDNIESISLMPEVSKEELYTTLGQYYKEYGQYEEAVSYLVRAIEANEQYSLPRTVLIDLYLEVNQEEVEIPLELILDQVSMKSSALYLRRGIYYLRNKQYIEALREFVYINDDEYRFYKVYNEAICYQKLGKYVAAIRCWGDIINLREEALEAYYYEAVLYEKLRDFEMAREFYETYCDKALEDGRFYYRARINSFISLLRQNKVTVSDLKAITQEVKQEDDEKIKCYEYYKKYIKSQWLGEKLMYEGLVRDGDFIDKKDELSYQLMDYEILSSLDKTIDIEVVKDEW